MKSLMRGFGLILISLLVNSVAGATFGATLGCDPAISAVVANGIAFVGANYIPNCSVAAGVFTEIWTGEMIKAFRTAPESLGWYDRIRSYDQYVGNDVIHFTEIGGDPKVLVNNTTYPLNITKLDDADKPISLDRFDTEATPVTDDELHAVSYDKMSSVQERHRESLLASKYKKAIHAIAPDKNATGENPVLTTTGEADGTRKRLCVADLVALKAALDAMGTPSSERILVLSSQHANDLLLTDKNFAQAYNINDTEGKITRLYGFDIYEFDSTPYYTAALNEKGFGIVPSAGDLQSSVAFHVPSQMKANGSVQFYHSEASSDPLYHRNLVNFRAWSICLPLKSKSTRAAIVCGAV